MSQFSCGEKKCAYLKCFWLAPHVKQLLKDIVYFCLTRRRLQTEVDGLVKSADEFAQKAEDTGGELQKKTRVAKTLTTKL